MEFWATWCIPCIRAMKELEILQKKFGNQLEILTISTDKISNLLRYINNTNTSLKIAFDTTHHDIFNYSSIPHTILIDKNGIIIAIITPDKINDKIIEDFVAGKEIEIIKKQDRPTNLGLYKEYKNQFYKIYINR